MKKSTKMVSNLIRDHDLFGHPIELNFNKSGSRHNTVLGGFLSIIIKSTLLFFAVIIMIRMFTYGANTER